MSETQTLSWKHSGSWIEAVRDLLGPYITDDVVEYFLQHPPEFVVSDDLSWLDETIAEVTGKSINSKALLADCLRSRYSTIQAYHACSPVDIDSYRNHGLLPLNIENTHEFVRHFLAQKAGVPLAVIEAAILRQHTGLRQGRIFFGLDDQMLVKHCGHYLLYGSEYIVAIAVTVTSLMNNGTDYRKFLKNRGKPTLITCNIPLSDVDDQTVEELSGVILREAFEDILRPDRPYDPLGFGFEILVPLLPSNIVAINHIDQVHDPLNVF